MPLKSIWSLTKHQAMKMYWESAGTAPRITIFGTRRRWVASPTPGETAPSSHHTRGQETPRALSDVAAKRKKSQSLPENKIQSSSLQPSHWVPYYNLLFQQNDNKEHNNVKDEEQQ